MQLTTHRVELPLARPFTISRGTLTTQPSLYVVLEHEGCRGLGEVTANTFYGHTLDSIEASLEAARPRLEVYLEQRPEVAWDAMQQALGGDTFAMAALDIAAHDWHARRQGIPTWQDWGLSWETVTPSSYTIGIDTLETMVQKLREAPGWPVYKIKLGTDRDLEIVRRLRQETDARFRVDANCGWAADQAIELSQALAELGVEFIEQPLPIDAPDDDKCRLFEGSALPLIADEDCQVPADVARCRGRYHGVNVKICKCGGLSPALRMLRQARELGLQTMVGCMIESHVGISAAAQLLPLLDYADLDGAVLLRDQPATGLKLDRGTFPRPELPGCGAEILEERLPAFHPGAVG